MFFLILSASFRVRSAETTVLLRFIIHFIHPKVKSNIFYSVVALHFLSFIFLGSSFLSRKIVPVAQDEMAHYYLLFLFIVVLN